MIHFAIRNLKNYFRDKIGLFFSFFSVLISIALYVLFLGRVWTNAVAQFPGAAPLMYSWLFAGISTMATVTTSLGAYASIVRDKAFKIYKDIACAPVKHSKIVGGYVISGLVISFAVASFALLVGIVILYQMGMAHFSFLEILHLVGTTALIAVSSASLTLLLVAPLSSLNGYGTVSSVVGTLIGFLAGIYIPLGNLSSGIQGIIKLFPVTHGAALLRQQMMAKTIEKTFASAPEAIRASFEKAMGIRIAFGDFLVEPGVSAAFLALSSLLFALIAIPLLFKKMK